MAARVAGRRRSLRGADPIVCQGSLRKERGFHRFCGHYCMKVEVSGYKLRLEKTQKIEAI